jgi:hypothetical protein
VIPLTDEGAAARLDFRITMGLRSNEPQWKETLNSFIAEHQDAIQAILLDYGVPLLDRQGHPIEAAAGKRQGALEQVPERMAFAWRRTAPPMPDFVATGATSTRPES